MVSFDLVNNEQINMDIRTWVPVSKLEEMKFGN